MKCTVEYAETKFLLMTSILCLPSLQKKKCTNLWYYCLTKWKRYINACAELVLAGCLLCTRMFAASHLKTLQGKATCETETDAAIILT
jgi:hypothetical protein